MTISVKLAKNGFSQASIPMKTVENNSSKTKNIEIGKNFLAAASFKVYSTCQGEHYEKKNFRRSYQLRTYGINYERMEKTGDCCRKKVLLQ